MAQIQEEATENEYLAFVTHNIADFSLPNGNQKKPYPDFAAYFEKSDASSAYYINLAEALRDISPDLESDLMIEQEVWDIPLRELSEIIKEENKLFDIIWYHRYKMRVYRITEEVNASPEIKNKKEEIKRRVLDVVTTKQQKISKRGMERKISALGMTSNWACYMVKCRPCAGCLGMSGIFWILNKKHSITFVFASNSLQVLLIV